MKTDPSDYRKVIQELARIKSSEAEVFSDFCRIVACSLALQTREEEYLEVIKRYTKDELLHLSAAMGMLILLMEDHPLSDRLGIYYQEVASKGTRDRRGEFYTPEHICDFMAQIIMDENKIVEEGIPVTMSEPACGAGGMILGAAKLLPPEHRQLLRVTCWDLSPVACDMCYINLTLWGIPAKIVWGNSLSLEVHNGWKNIHWATVGEDQRLRYKELFSLLESGNASERKVEVPYDRVDLEFQAHKQLELDLC